jgi:murein DD-endopeptidase MepM/ murein hydrolase activator NlpD
MNIIIVSRRLRVPMTIKLRELRGMLSAAAVVSVIALTGMGIGYLGRGASGAAEAELQRLRANLSSQQEALRETRELSQMEINALALRLGELQAQANRLNALGDRLTRIANLEEGEFDFNQEPGLGGIEPSQDAVEPALSARIDRLAMEMSSSGRQLDLLESLLSGQEVDLSLTPSGLPIRSGYASSSFGHRSDPFSGGNQYHRGMDFSGPRGSDILSVADGVVVFSGRYAGYGNMIDIDHGSGYMTRYAHNDQNLVQIGERIRAGDVIAKMGRTGRATGTHVHFEVWRNGSPINPRQFLARSRG